MARLLLSNYKICNSDERRWRQNASPFFGCVPDLCSTNDNKPNEYSIVIQSNPIIILIVVRPTTNEQRRFSSGALRTHTHSSYSFIYYYFIVYHLSGRTLSVFWRINASIMAYVLAMQQPTQHRIDWLCVCVCVCVGSRHIRTTNHIYKHSSHAVCGVQWDAKRLGISVELTYGFCGLVLFAVQFHSFISDWIVRIRGLFVIGMDGMMQDEWFAIIKTTDDNDICETKQVVDISFRFESSGAMRMESFLMLDILLLADHTKCNFRSSRVVRCESRRCRDESNAISRREWSRKSQKIEVWHQPRSSFTTSSTDHMRCNQHSTCYIQLCDVHY